jgi:hypothetical protein
MEVHWTENRKLVNVNVTTTRPSNTHNTKSKVSKSPLGGLCFVLAIIFLIVSGSQQTAAALFKTVKTPGILMIHNRVIYIQDGTGTYYLEVNTNINTTNK